MNKVSSKLCFVSVIALLIYSLTGCNAVKNERIYAKGEWLYSIEQDESKVFTSNFQKLDRFSNLNEFFEDDRGFVWLKFQFEVPESLKNKELSFFGGRISMADVTYCNGDEIGRTGIMPPENEFSAWNETRLYPIPSTTLNEDGKNEILIKLWVHSEGNIPDTIFIGDSVDAKFYANTERFLNSTLNLMCAFCMVVISVYQFIMFLCRKKNTESLWFAILNIMAAIYLSLWYVQEIVVLEAIKMSFLLFQKIFSEFMIFVLVTILIEFINAYVKRKEHWILRLVRYILVIVPSVLIFIQKDYSGLKGMRNIFHIFLVPQFIYIVYIIAKSIIVKRQGAISLLIGFIPFIACLIFDFIPRSVIGVENLPFFSTYSWMIVIMSFLFILAERFAKSLNEVEDLNKNLENKVEQRTQELSESNAKLAEANEQAQRDLDLAVMVQKNFYPSKAPKVKGWDIAYVFNPKAGVSGDLYDFFYKGDELKGCCLFDVSGHGIGSGLVTMLSKNIISREFEKGSNETISTVMSNISEAIGEEKGNIENYLTGILLRIKGSHVEYVNGAHPALLCRSGKSGKVMKAMLKEETASGSPVGIYGFPTEYSGISFNVRPGDALLLYTDCLYESRNSAGIELGQDNVERMFSEVGNGSAKEMLDNLLDSFQHYIEDVPVKDDLTCIVLKKL